jgi:predicted nuclease of predicted toxin-antitoxin system
VWQHAIRNNLILVTQDVDFVNLSLLRGHPPKVIWLRCGNQPSRVIEGILRSNAADIQAFAADPKTGFMELFR